jgi:hypothetical protein
LLKDAEAAADMMGVCRTWDDRQSVALVEAAGIANVRLTLKREIFLLRHCF